MPLFRCGQWTSNPNYTYSTSIQFCLAEKVTDMSAFILILVVSQQIYLHVAILKYSITDPRMVIFILALVSAVNTFLHYAIFTADKRAQSYFSIVICQFLTLYLCCYYYVNKASGLLESKQFYQYLLKTFLLISLAAILIIGFILRQQILLHL